MNRIEIQYAQLNMPLFLAGTNLGTKLDVTRRPMSLVYDRQNKELLVYFNNKISIVPVFGGVSDMTPVDPSAFDAPEPKKEAPKVAPVHHKPVKAQVSSPTDHVFDQGAGKTRD